MKRRTRRAPPLGVTLDAAHADPLHRQIGEQMRHAILERRLAPGTKLPSSRLMAQELNCARGTILLALDQLIAEGYVISRAGSGMSIAPDLPDEMLAAPRIQDGAGQTSPDKPRLSRRAVASLTMDQPTEGPSADPRIAFPTGQPDREAFPFRLWAKLLEQEWRRPAWQIAGAPHPFGHFGLREAIASYLGMSRGFVCTAHEIVVTSGLRQSLSTLASIVLDADDQAWIEEPGFGGTRDALASVAVKPVPVPIDTSGFSVDSAMARAPRARLAVVAPAHHFPLGTVLSLQRRLELLSWAEQTGSWIAEDDFDGEYRYAGRPLAPLRALDRAGRVAYLGSFSKLLFPTLRLSFLVLPSSLIPAAETIMAAVPARASLIGQGALARFIAEGHLATHLRRTRQLYAGRQQALIASAKHHLAGLLDIAPDPGGMHVVGWPAADLTHIFDDIAVTTAAAEESLTVTPLSECYSGRRKLHGLILGYAGTPEDEIDRAIQRLRAVLVRWRAAAIIHQNAALQASDRRA